MPSVDPLRAALFLIVAFVLAGILHSAWLRSDQSRAWQIPIDGGRTFRGRRLFGDNKTLRGFMVMTPATALSFAILSASVGMSAHGDSTGLWRLTVPQYAALGAWTGLGFMLAELPNSFIKRQLDIAPGTAPKSAPVALLCFLGDRLDSILGMLLAVSLAVATPWQTWAWVLVLGPAIHWSFSVVLYRLGVKARPA